MKVESNNNGASKPFIYYTFCDRLWEIAKYLSLAGFTLAIHYLMQVHALSQDFNKFTDLKFSIRDLAISLAAFVLFRLITDRLLYSMFDLETPGVYDRIMMEDAEGNWTNIIGVLRFEKMEFEPFRDLIFERLKNVNRCRSKMVKIFGVWYFKKMGDKEFDKKKDVIVQKVEGIHTD